MGFIKVSCPSCGGDVELSEDRESGFCTFCGSKIVRDKILVEHKGNISLDGVANEKSLLERALLFMESKDFINAQNYFERVLDINPRCSRAYMGKLMCKLCVTNIQDLGLQIIPLETYKEYSLAVRFATLDELQIYKELNKKTKENFDQEIKNLVSEKNHYQDELFSLNKMRNNRAYVFVLASFLSVVVFFAISVLGAFGVVLLVSGVVTAIIYNIKLKEMDSKISATKTMLNDKDKEIYNLTSKYNG